MEFKDKKSFVFILGLLLLTMLLLLGHRFSMNRTLTVSAEEGFPVSVVSDAMIGGKSVAKLQQNNGATILECAINAGVQFPYCNLDYDLSKEKRNGEIKGLDLSVFDRIEIWAKYKEFGTQGFRISFLNFNPAYSTFGDVGSLKFNSVEFFGFSQSTYPLNITRDSLQVATWWIVDHKIDVAHSSPEITDVRTIKFGTPSKAGPGTYTIQVEKIVFKGKYISAKVLYRSILTLWVCCAVIFLVRALYFHRRALKASEYKQFELEEMNRQLNTKSQKFEEMAIHDPLTGVLNREGLHQLIFDSANVLEGIRENKGLCIVFLDLDNFKTVNYDHGHNVGDEVLIEFTRIISSNTRKSDYLGRWGGEEFILACLGQTLEEVVKVAERLRSSVESHDWPLGLHATCSIGVAKMTDEDAMSLINRADLALYQAKEQGKNQVVVSEV